MKKFASYLVRMVLLAAVTMTAGCLFVVQVDPTRVRAQNDLYDLIVDVDGTEYEVTAVDLDAVVIGDVVYSSIVAGEVTATKEIGETGVVDVYVGSADVTIVEYVGIVGFETVYVFEDIDPMETTIDAGELNTVVFDEYTAGVIFSPLAKAPKR